MTAIKYSVNVQISGGPTLAYNDELQVDAYDRLDVVIPKENAGTSVEVHPGQAGDVKLLAIRSSTADEKVAFENGAGVWVGLKNPLLLTGAGVGVLAGGGPGTMKFKNGLTTPVTVTIIVGRSAIQP
ncbi:MAG TPA: hypothetical protein VEO54_16825 [Thermoanaerobaculia bacterium]|nr:hypothetical protein [Thermoanaerobaculia bacterium]